MLPYTEAGFGDARRKKRRRKKDLGRTWTIAVSGWAMSASEQSASGIGTGTHSWDAPLVRDLTGVTLGDFEVERLLGRGGMGEVYLARQISLHRPVALKVLRPDLLTKPTYLSRFEAEATTVAKLNHPNIVHIYTLGCVEGIRFIAMEYVQGTNLRDYIAKKGALELMPSLSIMRQAGVAIGAAGELGLIHRDIKPENLLLTRKGQVKIADFGLCRDQDADRLDLTQPGVTLGTPLYMSPEQAQGHALDHRSDLYSLGVTFYHMLAGEPPFRADTPLALALKHVKDTPVSLAVHRSDLPPDLVALVMKLMAKNPDERYQSAAEMLRDLSRIRGALNTMSISMSEPEAAVSGTGNGNVIGIGDGHASATATTTFMPRALLPGTWTRLASLGGTRRGLAAVLVLALLAGLGYGWLSRPEDLLSERAGALSPGLPSSRPPALWMEPGWQTIPRQTSADEQYRYAQLGASNADQEAAWIAVPGYFPAARAWASQAYIQLARVLLRRHDAERLRILGPEIERWNATQEHEKELVTIIQAAAKAIDGDQEGTIVELEKLRLSSTIDPALLELALEVTIQATHSASRTDSLQGIPPGLRSLQQRLLGQWSTVENSERQGRGRSG
jgi:serine/threonine-protein kinase